MVAFGSRMKRRNFLAFPATFGIAAMPARAAEESQVVAIGDGIPHSPQQYVKLLNTLAEKIEPDTYSQNGTVERLEKAFADTLGKERAVWMPTGTLANHIAVRLLAGERRRVLVQQECHL